MGFNQQFRDSIKQTAIGDERIYSIYATVKAVSGSFCSVITFDGEETIEDVELQSSTSANGLLLTPVIDSIVLVSWLSKNKPFVTMFSDLESVSLRGEDHGGLVKVEELTERLNNIEKAFNSLVNTYNLHTHPSSNTPTASRGNTTTTTKKSDIENDKVKHG